MKSRKAKKTDQYDIVVAELGTVMIQLVQARRASHRLTAALAAQTANRRSLARNYRDELLREKRRLLKQLCRQKKVLAEHAALTPLRPDKQADIRIVQKAIRTIMGQTPTALLQAALEETRHRLDDDNVRVSARFAACLGFQYAGLTSKGEAEIRELLAL